MAKVTRAEQSERTQQKLMDATRDLVVEGGWSAASSRAIAGRAGVNLALTSFHFGGKSELFRATLDRCVSSVSSAYGPWSEARDLDEFIEMCLKAAPEIARDNNARFVYAALLESQHDSAIGAAVRRQLEAYREDISQAVKRIGFSGATARRATVFLAAAMDGLMIHSMLDPSTDAVGAVKFLGEALRAVLAEQAN